MQDTSGSPNAPFPGDEPHPRDICLLVAPGYPTHFLLF